MERVAAATSLIDLLFQGQPRVIATGAIETPAGVLLVDPGPASCLPVLRRELSAAGVADRDLHGVLLTHIHLDHAGASGVLVREAPHLVVYVHERGARHLIDPAKLIASATRIYGADMDRLWGEFAPVPAAAIRPLAGRGRLDIGGRRIDVADTPGHATHHVCAFDPATGIVFTGDTAGIRTGELPYVLPPTPPPDIDIPAWRASLEAIRAWEPAAVSVTHFGLKRDAAVHLDLLAAELDAWDRLSREVAAGTDEAAREARFIEQAEARIVAHVGAADAAVYRAAVSLQHCWAGLARYQQRRQAADANEGGGR